MFSPEKSALLLIDHQVGTMQLTGTSPSVGASLDVYYLGVRNEDAAFFQGVGLIGPANLLVPMPTWRTHFSRSVLLDVYGGGFWRQSAGDGIYGGGGNHVRGPGGSDERFIGSQINALFGWTISRNIYLEPNDAHFLAGAFLADTGPSEDVDYLGATLAFRF